jgi:hypothetical protein
MLDTGWIVPRSFAWLEKYCRLWENGEHKLYNTLPMRVLAFIPLLPKNFEQAL